MPGLLTMSRLPVLLLLAALAGCADSGGGGVATSTEPPAAAPAPVTCPVDLSFVKSELVTPYPKLEEFIGKDALDATFSKSIDQMIADSGGVDSAIAGGEHYVQLYQEVLKNEAVMRDNFKKNGQDEEWIDTYFLSNKDGLTINQAFVDAVKCRAAQKPASSPTPSPTATGNQTAPAPAG
ncbi:MAG TPA: hypothetical protein VIE35_09995 [Dongiaceae bacterium]